MTNYNYDEGLQLIKDLEPNGERFHFIAWMQLNNSWKLIFATMLPSGFDLSFFDEEVKAAIERTGVSIPLDDVRIADVGDSTIRAIRKLTTTDEKGIHNIPIAAAEVDKDKVPECVVYRA